ncbi:putative Protein phosphatase 1 regulatory subunit 42 [Hypsibius exemplaris]|uniref:Protein phosphatase 1 regulatory subunit 42 n=1 Tax=Hypsibius exemplaris TaxID=2072580 RepID=A0A1W0X035_HYPEX|nr:putative Protein phosphatase 1 regulatory subunit 42 [Hypsibius exemplaris]
MCRCPKLTVLYLFDNKLQRVCNLEFCLNLTHLYLQNNHIRRIENIASLVHLQKLFLSNNRIAILEGLEYNQELEELHIDHQALRDGETFDVSPITTDALSHSLTFLDIAGNEMSDMSNIRALRRLTHLRAARNQFDDIMSILPVLQNLPQLLEADFSGNPVCKTLRYREMILIASTSIRVLDGREVSETNRQFLLRMKDSRSRTSLPFHTKPKLIVSSGFSREFTPPSSSPLMKTTSPPKVVSKHILPGLNASFAPRQFATSKASLQPQGSNGPLYQQTSSYVEIPEDFLQTGQTDGQFGNTGLMPSVDMNKRLAHKHSLGEEMFPPQNWKLF